MYQKKNLTDEFEESIMRNSVKVNVKIFIVKHCKYEERCNFYKINGCIIKTLNPR